MLGKIYEFELKWDSFIFYHLWRCIRMDPDTLFLGSYQTLLITLEWNNLRERNIHFVTSGVKEIVEILIITRVTQEL